MVDFWKSCFPDQTLSLEKDDLRSKQWLFLGFDVRSVVNVMSYHRSFRHLIEIVRHAYAQSDDPLRDFTHSLVPYMCVQYGRLHKEEFPELVQSRILLGPYDYNFIKAAVDITNVFVAEVLDSFVKEQGWY
jgi:hypothetical protein